MMPTIAACVQLLDWKINDTNVDILECLTDAMYCDLITLTEFRECVQWWKPLDFADRLEQMQRFQLTYRDR